MAVVKSLFPPPFVPPPPKPEPWPDTELMRFEERPDVRPIDYFMIGQEIIFNHD